MDTIIRPSNLLKVGGFYFLGKGYRKSYVYNFLKREGSIEDEKTKHTDAGGGQYDAGSGCYTRGVCSIV